MKFIAWTLALGLALAAPVARADAHPCATGAHPGHCVSHRHIVYHHHYHHHYHYAGRYGEGGVLVAPPPPPPYTYYYPPTPASVFDLPPEPYVANQLQWLMNSENDPPFADTPRYPYYNR
jgi:hypothetical protein